MASSKLQSSLKGTYFYGQERDAGSGRDGREGKAGAKEREGRGLEGKGAERSGRREGKGEVTPVQDLESEKVATLLLNTLSSLYSNGLPLSNTPNTKSNGINVCFTDLNGPFILLSGGDFVNQPQCTQSIIKNLKSRFDFPHVQTKSQHSTLTKTSLKIQEVN